MSEKKKKVWWFLIYFYFFFGGIFYALLQCHWHSLVIYEDKENKHLLISWKRSIKAPPSKFFIEKSRALLILWLLFDCFMQGFSHTYQKWCAGYEELIKSKLPETVTHTILKWYHAPQSHSINGDVSLKRLYTEPFLSIISSSAFLFFSPSVFWFVICFQNAWIL